MQMLIAANQANDLTDLNLAENFSNNFMPIPQAFVFKGFGNESSDSKLDQVRAHILFEVIIYSILFIIGAFSNLLVLYKLNLKTKRKSSLNILISQLNLADLIVSYK